MGGRRGSALLLGLLCLLSGAPRPGGAQEATSHVATTSPLFQSSADLPDLSVSATSEAPGNELITETERPPPPPSSPVSVPDSDGTGSNVTMDPGDVTASNETSPVTSANETTSADATQPPSPNQPLDAASNVTAGTAPELPSLLATLGTPAARTQPSADSTLYTTPAMSFHSTWLSAITTSLFITTTVISPKPSSTTTQSRTAAPHTTRAEVQRGPSVLEVGDDKDPTGYHSKSSSNPLFVMIVSIFTIMVVMVVVVVGFHRYKKRNSRTEFRRLQDLPMDDMMEDTPLSLYSY